METLERSVDLRLGASLDDGSLWTNVEPTTGADLSH